MVESFNRRIEREEKLRVIRIKGVLQTTEQNNAGPLHYVYAGQ